MSIRCLLIFLLGLFAGNSCLWAFEQVACAIDHGFVWVRVDTRVGALNFLLDSGAGSSVLDLASARRLGLDRGASELVEGVLGNSSAQREQGFNGRVGNVALTKSLLAMDLRGLSGVAGRRVDGLLGVDFFRHQAVQIDCKGRTVRLGTSSELVGDLSRAKSVLALAAVKDAICLESVINTRRALLRVDTGCTSPLEWTPLGARGSLSSTALGVSAAQGPRVNVSLQLGPSVFPSISTGIHRQGGFSGENGLLGNGFWSRFIVTIDVPSKRLVLQEPNPARP